MFIHDLIKIKYSREGFLPDLPPHLISDEEMINAFFPFDYLEHKDKYEDSLIFFITHYDLYKLVDIESQEASKELEDTWKELCEVISHEINKFLASIDAQPELPLWVYQYMLGEVITYTSDIHDINDLINYLELNPEEEDFNVAVAEKCAHVTTKLKTLLRQPPSPFGTHRLIKYYRTTTLDD